MAIKTNCIVNGKPAYRLRTKVGVKKNKDGIWVDNIVNFYGKNKSEAEARKKAYLERLRPGMSSDEYLGILIDRWIKDVFLVSDYAESTISKYISAYKNVFSNTKVVGMKLADVTALDIQDVYNRSTAGPGYIKSAHGLIRLFFKYVDLNGISRDITGSLIVPKRPKTKDDFNDGIVVWSTDEIRNLIEALKNHRLRFLIVLAAGTGARFSELLALTYDDIADGQVKINKQVTEVHLDRENAPKGIHLTDLKSAASYRTLPLSKKVLEEFEVHKRWHEEEMRNLGYTTKNIFTTSTGNYYYRRNIIRAIVRACKRNNIPYQKFHAFRHTFGSNLSKVGIAIETNAQLLGHSSVNVTKQYYINIDAEQRRDAVEKLSEVTFG